VSIGLEPRFPREPDHATILLPFGLHMLCPKIPPGGFVRFVVGEGACTLMEARTPFEFDSCLRSLRVDVLDRKAPVVATLRTPRRHVSLEGAA
jgi:hypothetical protein